MTSGSPGKGWWKASDANWYPPETHPDYLPPQPTLPAAPVANPASSDEQAASHGPGFPHAQTPSPQPRAPKPAGSKKPKPQRRAKRPARATIGSSTGSSQSADASNRLAIVVLALLGIVVVAMTYLLFARITNQPVAAELPATEPPRPPAAAIEPPRPPAAAIEVPTPTVSEPSPEALAAVEAARRVDTALSYGIPVPVRFDTTGPQDQTIWNVTVSEPRNMTAAVEANNLIVGPPPDGFTYVGFTIEMTLASAPVEPVAPQQVLLWEVHGGASAMLHNPLGVSVPGCGAVPNAFPSTTEVFVGGSLRGTVCLLLPVEDSRHPDTEFLVASGDEQTLRFGVKGQAVDPAPVGERGDAWNQTVAGFGSEVSVTLENSDGGDPATWNTLVSPARSFLSGTELALPLDKPLPEGFAFVGFDVTMTLAASTAEPVTVGLQPSWEIFGGSSNAVYRTSTVADGASCQADKPFDAGAEMFVGGAVEGVICLLVPIADIRHPDTRISLAHGGSRTVFGPDVQSATPSPIGSSGGPPAVAGNHAVDESIEVGLADRRSSATGQWEVEVSALSDVSSLSQQDVNDAVVNALLGDKASDRIAVAKFDVRLELLASADEPATPADSFEWYILGGATLRGYVDSQAGVDFCGRSSSVPLAERRLLAGRAATGSVCIAIPAEDLSHPDTRIAIRGYDDTWVTFLPR